MAESFGIYTLANDAIYDQLVALLNSIEANVGADVPVCVIPFDHRLSRVREEISTRPHVRLLDNPASIERWETFAQTFVAAHPMANQTKRSHPRWYGGKLHRKFVAFDGPFERFVFFDGDSLAMKPVDDVIHRLDSYDFVFDDWEHKKADYHAALDFAVVEAASAFTTDELRSQLHCSSFFGAKRELFSVDAITTLQRCMVEQGEAAWVNGQGWWDDAFLFNYMTLKLGRPQFNFTQSPNAQERTGNCANSDPFVVRDNVLYNQDGGKPIHRIHYMGYSSTDFNRLCLGEDVDIYYRDVFLHYRFLKHPEQRPAQLSSPSLWVKTNRFVKRATQKFGAPGG